MRALGLVLLALWGGDHAGSSETGGSRFTATGPWRVSHWSDTTQTIRRALPPEIGSADMTFRPTLSFTCLGHERVLGVIVATHPEGPAGRRLRMALTFDDASTVETSAKVLEGMDVLLDHPKVVIRALLPHKRLTLQVRSWEGATDQNASFDLTGFREAVTQVAKACGWDPAVRNGEP